VVSGNCGQIPSVKIAGVGLASPTGKALALIPQIIRMPLKRRKAAWAGSLFLYQSGSGGRRGIIPSSVSAATKSTYKLLII